MQFYFGGLGRCSLLLVLAAPAAALDVVCPDASIQEVACVEAGAVIDCDDATTVYLSYLALPPGSDAHPGVLYNHGGSGIQLGGDPAEAAGQLACAGYVGYAKRRVGGPIGTALGEMEAGLVELLALAYPRLDPTRLALMGYSRGGLLGLRLAELHPTSFAAVVLMAPAPGAGSWTPGGGGSTTMDTYLSDVDDIGSETAFLVMVASNDRPPPLGNNPHNNLVDLATTVHLELDAVVDSAVLDLRPNWNESETLGGHALFDAAPKGQELDASDDTTYWSAAIDFLDTHLAASAGVDSLSPRSLWWLAVVLGLAALGVLRWSPRRA